jgi:hypothetical protein
MRAILVALLLVTTGATAAAQQCVTCRGDRCKGMFWIPPCADKKPPRPDKPPPAPATTCGAQGLQLEVDFPPKVDEGDLLGIRMRTNCEAWLVVYFLEESGAGAILWPSRWEPAPTVGPGHPASLLSAREVAAGKSLEAALAQSGVPSHEQFVVFAFADRADFERLRPRGKTDGRSYAAELGRKLPALAPGRWATFTARYTIQPKP